MNPLSDAVAQAAIGVAARELRLPAVRDQGARFAEIAARVHPPTWPTSPRSSPPSRSARSIYGCGSPARGRENRGSARRSS